MALRDNDKQLGVSFAGTVLATVAVYLVFSRWVASEVLLGMAVWAAALCCYPLLKDESQSSFVSYALRMALYVGSIMLAIYLFRSLKA